VFQVDNRIRTCFENLESKDREVQYEAFLQLVAATEKKVDWAYEVWDQLAEDLNNPDNHRRARGSQFLCNLAISDPENRIQTVFPAIWEVTYDKKFVTARHSLQAIWRIGLAGDKQKEMVINRLIDRFHTCENEKNYTLIRFDIIQGLKNLYSELKEEEIKQQAMDLIDTVEESKYKKKYLSLWK
jgi:hypothetical protein